jgi:hypothetical protein
MSLAQNIIVIGIKHVLIMPKMVVPQATHSS